MKKERRAIALLSAVAACAMTFAGMPAAAMADESSELTPQYTYTSQNGMTFEKISPMLGLPETALKELLNALDNL